MTLWELFSNRGYHKLLNIMQLENVLQGDVGDGVSARDRRLQRYVVRRAERHGAVGVAFRGPSHLAFDQGRAGPRFHGHADVLGRRSRRGVKRARSRGSRAASRGRPRLRASKFPDGGAAADGDRPWHSRVEQEGRVRVPGRRAVGHRRWPRFCATAATGIRGRRSFNRTELRSRI